MEELQKALQVAFATTYAFMLKAQNFHWNVEGPGFVQYHKLFGKIYDEVEDNLDDFAELLRAERARTPGSFSELATLSITKDSVGKLAVTEMLEDLYKDNGGVHMVLMTAYNLAEETKEIGVCTFIGERIEAHRKHGWMLYSSMQPEA